MPQQSTPPDVSSAQKLASPCSVAKLATPLNVPVPPTPTTATGVELFVVVPSPSPPYVFCPQQSTPPDLRTAHVSIADGHVRDPAQ